MKTRCTTSRCLASHPRFLYQMESQIGSRVRRHGPMLHCKTVAIVPHTVSLLGTHSAFQQTMVCACTLSHSECNDHKHAGEPQTAEEYLRRVRAEAAACPRVVRVEFDPSKLKKNSQAAPSTSQGAATGAPAYVGADAVPLSTHEATHIAQQPPQEPASSLQGVTKQGVAEKLNMTSPGSGEAGAPRPRRAAYVTRLLAAGSLPQAPPWAQPSHT